MVMADVVGGGRSAKVAVLSFSRIARDRRVLRQCALLDAMGHRPLVIAYADEGETIPFSLKSWPVPRPTTWHRLKTVARQAPAHLGSKAARAGFWIEPRYRWALSELMRFRPDFVIANDWPALVVAAALKEKTGASIHYDTHEFATLEFDESLWWRLIYKPMVTHLERAYIGAASSISTVGPRLSEALQARYDLAVAPLVVRNIPDRITPREPFTTAWPLRILYHGQILPDRGLEALIDSMPRWHVQHKLTIRGDGHASYLAGLRRRVAETGCNSFVVFEPAVSPCEVMPLASRSADLGVHFTPLGTKQRHFSLPNKFFEYVGSGLAVAVSPGADLKRIVESYGVGVVSRDASAAAIAEAINGLTRELVVNFKAKARNAARTLCWENEQSILREALEPSLQRLSTMFTA